jgi:hypothetical protein
MAKNPVKIQYTSTVNKQSHYTMSEEWQKNPVKIVSSTYRVLKNGDPHFWCYMQLQ